MKILPRPIWLVAALVFPDVSQAQSQLSAPNIISFNTTSFNGDDTTHREASVYAATLEKDSLGMGPKYAPAHIFSWTCSQAIELNNVTLHQAGTANPLDTASIMSSTAASAGSGATSSTGLGNSPNDGIFLEPKVRLVADGLAHGLTTTITSMSNSSSGTITINWLAYIQAAEGKSIQWFGQTLYLALAWNGTGVTTSRRFTVTGDTNQDSSFITLVNEPGYSDQTPYSPEVKPVAVSSATPTTMSATLVTDPSSSSTTAPSAAPSAVPSGISTTSANPKLGTGAIAGIAIGAALGLLLLALLIVICVMRQRKQKKRDDAIAQATNGRHGTYGHELSKEAAITTIADDSPRSGSYDTAYESSPRENEKSRAAPARFEMRSLRGPGRYNSKRAPMPSGSVAPDEVPMALTTDEHIPLRSGSGHSTRALPGTSTATATGQEDGGYTRYTDHPTAGEVSRESPTHAHRQSLPPGQHATPASTAAATASAAKPVEQDDLPPPPSVLGHDAAREAQPSALSHHRAMTPYGHLVEEGMTEEEIRAMEEEERHLDVAIENAGHNR